MADVTHLPRLPRGLQMQTRDRRRAIDVALHFVVRCAGQSFTGLRLSRERLLLAVTTDMAVPSGAVELHIPLSGFELVLPMRISPSVAPSGTPAAAWFEIVELDGRAEDSLAQLIRSIATGWLPTIDDFAAPRDAETPIKAAQAPPAAPRIAPWLALAGSVFILVAALGVAAGGIYRQLTSIEAGAAAVTAPRIDLVSPDYGSVGPGAVRDGMEVAPGAPLVRLVSAEIAAGIETERAEIAYQQQQAMPQRDQLDRATQRLGALERRAAALAFASTCVCTVLWAAPAGTPVAPGALLASLAVTDPDKLRIEALVTPAEALAIGAGQRAEVRVAGADTAFAAVVETVRYAASPVPRVGLDNNRNGQATVVLVPVEPVDGLVPGAPANVVISK